jgi:xanthine dehydrogenase accessory factor
MDVVPAGAKTTCLKFRRAMEILPQVVELIDAGRRFALATVLRAEGSTPQKVGAKAIIEADGKIWGTLGGGMVEAETQRRGVEACRSHHPLVFDFKLDDAYAPPASGSPASESSAGPICGGTMRILIDPTVAKDRAVYARAADALRQRQRGVLLTRIRLQTQPEVQVEWFPQEAVPPDPSFPGAEAVRSCLERESARLFVESSRESSESTEVLVEPLIPKPLLLIAGGGHIGQALARQATLIGFEVTVVDDRPEFTAPALFPESVSTRRGDVSQEVAAFPLGEDTYVVIVTRGHEQDAVALAACIHSPAAYVGMIGSRRKVALLRQHFLQSGLATAEEFDRVFAPIGLDIGAVTVPEIATSIAAELIAVRRRQAAASTHMASQ